MNTLPSDGTGRVWWTDSSGEVKVGKVLGKANRTHTFVLVPRRWTEQDFKTGKLIDCEGTRKVSVLTASLKSQTPMEMGCK